MNSEGKRTVRVSGGLELLGSIAKLNLSCLVKINGTDFQYFSI